MHFVASIDSDRIRDPYVRRPDIDRELEHLFRLEDEDATELVLVRHAEAADDTGLPPEYGSDMPLSETGVHQATALGRRLADAWVEAIYTAPERCARETAGIIGSAVERPVDVHLDLRDIDYAETVEEIPACGQPSLAFRFQRQPRWDALPGFEPTRQFRRRAIAGIEAMMARHVARRIVVVTHSSVINAYLSMVLDIPRDVFFLPDNASVSIVRVLEDVYAVRSLNDVTHLRGITALAH